MGTVWRTRKRGEIEVRQRGSATAMVLAISTVLTVLSASALYLAESNATMTNHRNRRARALDVAEAGVNNYLWHLNHDENYYLTAVHPAQGQDSSGRDRWVDFEGGQYHLEIDPPDEGDSVIAVEATGKVETLKSKRTIRVEIRKKSFLSYLYFTDAERGESGSEIWWTSGDVVHGPLHTNGDMRITGRPAFEDMVTMAGHINKGRNYSPNFQRGHQEGTQPLQLPPGNSQLKAEAQNRGYYYYGQTTISLNSNGSLRVANANNRSTGPTGTVWPPSNGLVYVDGQTRAANPRHATNGNLYVSGTLSGRLTLAAKNNIYITDNVLNRDQTDDSSDMLGLAADNFVYVSRDAPRDIEIQAAILALKHSFGVEDYRSRPAKGDLTVRGAIIQKFRGPVGTFNPRTMRRLSGYSKDYWYDERMKNHQPPYFLEPVNASFEQVSWEEVNR